MGSATAMPDKPVVAVIGAGAMGSTFGGLLAEGGLDVTLVDVWRDHVDAINRDGLLLTGQGGDRRVRVRAVTSASEVACADVVFFQCKAIANAAAAAAARHLFADGSAVAVSFQNGLGSGEEIGGIVGMDRMIGGLTAQAALLLGPATIRTFADLPSYIGEIGGGLSPRVESLAAALSRAGLQTLASPAIMREKWGKLLVNIAFAGPSGLTGLTLGEVISHPQLSAVARNAMEEAAGVAAAVGVDLDPQARRAVFDRILGSEARHNKASVRADLTAGRRTEVDYIYGTVIRLARQNGIAVPTLEVLSALVKGAEPPQG